MKHTNGKTALAILTFGCNALFAAGKLAYVGAGCPVKHNDDTNIGKFINLDTPDKYVNVTYNIAGKVPEAKPWIHWGLDGWKEQSDPFPEAAHEQYIKRFNEQGIQIWLAFRPDGRDAVALAQKWLNKFKAYQNIAGISIDMEFYKSSGADLNAKAKALDEAIKAINPGYRLMFKGYMASQFPTYRGKGDLFFIHTSSESPIPEIVKIQTDFCNQVGKETPPVSCGGQIGYPNDEKIGKHHVTNRTYDGWIALKPDPVAGWSKLMTDAIQNPNQEIAFDWLTVTSSINPTWDLTKTAPIRIFGARSLSHDSRRLTLERTPSGFKVRLSDGHPETIPQVADILGRSQAEPILWGSMNLGQGR